MTTQSPPGPGFLRRWIVYVTVGETLGFLIPATVGPLTTEFADMNVVALYLLAMGAGLAEGTLLGLAQAFALRRSGIGIAVVPWVVATALAATLAWTVTLPALALPDLDWSSPPTIAGAVVAGVVVLLSIPVAQWYVLRAYLARAWRWIPINVVAWGVGLMWTFAPSPLVDETTPVAVLVPTYGVAGLLMALTVAVITGLGLRRMLTEA